MGRVSSISPGGSNVITRILTRGRQECQSSETRGGCAAGHEDVHEPGVQAAAGAGHAEETDPPLEPPEGVLPCGRLDSSPVRPGSDFRPQNCGKRTSWCWGSPYVSDGSRRKLIHHLIWKTEAILTNCVLITKSGLKLHVSVGAFHGPWQAGEAKCRWIGRYVSKWSNPPAP